MEKLEIRDPIGRVIVDMVGDELGKVVWWAFGVL